MADPTPLECEAFLSNFKKIFKVSIKSTLASSTGYIDIHRLFDLTAKCVLSIDLTVEGVQLELFPCRVKYSFEISQNLIK